MKKRIASIIMVLIMLASLLPASAFADKLPGSVECPHEWTWTVIKAATCTENGIKEGVCSLCHETTRVSIPALGHDWQETGCTEAGCLTDGVADYECARCGEKKTETLPATGHIWSAWCPVSFPDADGSYSMIRVCKSCGLEETKECSAELKLELTGTGDTAGKRAGDYVDVSFTVTNVFSETVEVYGVRDDGGTCDKMVFTPTQLAPGKSFDFTLRLRLTQNDIDAGGVSREVSVSGHKGENAESVSSNTVDAAVSLAGEEPFEGGMGGGSAGVPYLYVTETVVTGPNCRSGEDILLKVTVANSTEWYLGEVTIQDKLTGEYRTVTLADYSSANVYFVYNVKDSDIINSPIEDFATATSIEAGTAVSNTVYVAVDPLKKAGQLDVAKIINHGAENGIYYQFGETIEYEIIISNNTGVDLHDVEVYDVLHPGLLKAIGNMKNGETVSVPFNYFLMPEDINGWFTNSAYAYGKGPDSKMYNGIGAVTTAVGEEYVSSLEVTKTEISSPADGPFYTEGEVVSYSITVKNNSALTVSSVIVCDPKKSSWDIFPKIDSMDSLTLNFDYTVTAQDVINGKISSAASASGHYDEVNEYSTGSSDTVTVYTGKKNEELPHISQNCATICTRGFAAPGEKLTYLVSVSNPTNEDMTDVCIYSPSADKNPIFTSASIPAKSVLVTLKYEHTVTYQECCLEECLTTVYMNYTNAAGENRTVVSNTVSMPTGLLDQTVLITLTETSTPNNGNPFYSENEIISYDVTITNNSGYAIQNATISDIAHNKYWGIIANEPLIPVGATVTYPSLYKVEAGDIGTSFTNTATISGIFSNYQGLFNISNSVCSPCGEQPVVTHQGPLDGDGEEGCTVTLNADPDGDMGFVIESCGEHTAIDEQILAAVNAAADADGRRQAWEQAQTLWSDEIDRLYDELLERVEDPSCRTVIMNDRILFFAQEEALADTLREVYAADGETAAKLAAEELRNRCAELCGLLHQGGEDMLTGLVDEYSGLIGSECALTELEREAGYGSYLIDLCGMHRTAGEAAATLIGSQATQTALTTALDWTGVRAMWESEFNALMDARYDAASGTLKNCVASEHSSYLNWLLNHELFLDIFYENSIVRDSFMTKIIIERAALSCDIGDGITNSNAAAAGFTPVWNTAGGKSGGSGKTGTDGAETEKSGASAWVYVLIGVAAAGGAGAVAVTGKKKKSGGK